MKLFNSSYLKYEGHEHHRLSSVPQGVTKGPPGQDSSQKCAPSLFAETITNLVGRLSAGTFV